MSLTLPNFRKACLSWPLSGSKGEPTLGVPRGKGGPQREDLFPEKLLLLVHSLPVLSSQEEHCLPVLVSLVRTEAAGLVFKAVFMVGLTTLCLMLARSSRFIEYPIPHKL